MRWKFCMDGFGFEFPLGDYLHIPFPRIKRCTDNYELTSKRKKDGTVEHRCYGVRNINANRHEPIMEPFGMFNDYLARNLERTHEEMIKRTGASKLTTKVVAPIEK